MHQQKNIHICIKSSFNKGYIRANDYCFRIANGFLILFLLIVNVCFSYAANEKSLDYAILDVMTKYHTVGLSAVVVKDNKIVYTRTFGYNPDYCDSTLRFAIPTDGLHVIQSISKSFVSMAIMQLVEKGNINLDDDVNDYLTFTVRNPKYPNNPISIRMLMSHRSTINDKYYGWTFDQINPLKGKKWQNCYNDYQPGSVFSYCNLNYNLLGAIIELVTGERFFDYIDNHIISPLGLYASFNLTKLDSTRLIRSYQFDNKTRTFKKDSIIYNYQFYKQLLENYGLGSSSTACFSPSGGMKISVIDLAKYMMMYMNYGEYNGKRILSKESVIEMWRPQGKDESPNSYFSQYGLSFSRWSKIVDGETFIGITGGAHGVHSAMYFNPEKKYGFVVICNGCTYGTKMKDSIVKVLYDHFIKENSK